MLSVGSTVFYDVDDNGVQDDDNPLETGIEDVQVFLVQVLEDAAGMDSLVVIDSVLTDDMGNYLFDSLSPGDYQIRVNVTPEDAQTSSAGSTPADDDVDSVDDGDQDVVGGPVTTETFTLSVGEEPAGDDEDGQGGNQDDGPDDLNGNMTIDLGFVPDLSVGSTVFFDVNNDGMQDSTNVLENGITGVVVELLADLDGDGVPETVVATDTTDADGNYFFDMLPEGTYAVNIPTGPAGTDGASTPVDATDLNDDLQNGADNGDGSVTSAPFELSAGDEPVGDDEGSQGGDQDDADDEDGNMTIDFGFVPSASIGSTVFLDADNDSEQDFDEIGLDSILVFLAIDTSGMGDFVVIDSLLTDEDGNYLFDTLIPGDYIVTVVPPASTPLSSDGESGMDDNDDGNDDGIQMNVGDTITSPVITLSPGDEPQDEEDQGGSQDAPNDADGNMTVDFGLVPIGSIGSLVFADLDNDGLYDPMVDTFLVGVPLELYEDNNADGIPDGLAIAFDTTDATGLYLFDLLLPGNYIVGIPTPPEQNTISSSITDNTENVDGNDNGIQDMAGDPTFSGTIILTAGMEPTDGEEPSAGGDQDDGLTSDNGISSDNYGDMTVDFGFIGAVSVGSTVFLDLNDDGINQNDEDGVPNVVVQLFTAAGDFVGETITDDNGNYLFEGLVPGDYFIQLPGGQFVPGQLFPNEVQVSDESFNADDDMDQTNDGTQPDGPGTVITTGVFTLEPNTEPINGPNGLDGFEFGTGSMQDQVDDDNGNMTVDIGLFARVFDLALIKRLAPGQEFNVVPGDTVDYQIRIFNQGNVRADNILVSDYIPNGLLFDASINPGWTFEESIDADRDRVSFTATDFNGNGFLRQDTFFDISIRLVVNPAMDAFQTLTNVAEISDATDAVGGNVTDFDSPMDTDPDNDEFEQDNEIEGDGTNGGDEDNSDPAFVNVGGFDLALIKRLDDSADQTVAPGENVTFNITVINQGAIAADSIVISDYIVDGFTFNPDLNPNWILVDGNVAQTTLNRGEELEATVGLEPGRRVTVDIILTVDDAQFPDFADGDTDNPDGVQAGQRLVNTAEITVATDTSGVVQEDIDSVADMDPDNEGPVDDNQENGAGDTDGDGVNEEDEDDSDIAVVVLECFQDPGIDATIEVCLGCDEAEVSINLFESLNGRPNTGGTFSYDQDLFLDDDGNEVIIDLSDPTNVIIPGNLDRGESYFISYTIPAVNGCTEMTSTLTIDIIDIQNLSCVGFQNISLGEDCMAEILPEMILLGNMSCANSLEVTLLTATGDTLRDPNGLPTNIVGNEEINDVLLVSLSDPMCNNTCWGQITVEDKRPPVIDCPDDVSGFDDNDFICTDIDRILNMQSSLPFTGQPVLEDNCTPLGSLDLVFNDLLLPTADDQCDVRTILRTFIVTDESDNQARCTQQITVRPPTLDDVSIPTDSVVTFNCNETFATLPNGNPVPSLGGEAFITTAFGTEFVSGGAAYCNIGASFSDSRRIITCENTYKFVRTYTILDWCAVDADPIVFSQVIKVGDFDAPEFTGPVQDLDFDGVPDVGPLFFSTNAGDECAAFIRLDDPSIRVTDNCSADIFLSANIYPNGDLTATPIGTFVVDLNDGDAEISSAIPAGTHTLRYVFRDNCGNEDFEDIEIEIADRTAPVAICEDGLNISITAGQSQTDEASTGIAILTPEMIDAGSYDDCGEIQLFIARVNDANINTEPYDQELVLTCADLGVVRVGLRVIDEEGNVNDCWLDVLVEDKARPTCIQPAPVRISCIVFNETLPADIQEATDEELDAVFGAAFGVDNCEVNLEQTIIGSLNSCGVGNFTRRFTVTDGQGFTNTNACVQSIVVYGVHDYTVEFPVDVEGDCMDIPEYDGIESTERACDLIAVNVAVDTFRSQEAAEECFKLEVVYEIINWCEYDGEGQAYIIPRDGDGLVNRNPETQPLYLHVVPGTSAETMDDDFAFLSRFSDTRFDAFAPQRDNLLDNGDDNDGDDDDNGDDNIDDDAYAFDQSRGFFRYTQFIKIYDDVAPVIDTDFDSEDCFAGVGEECVADVTIDFTAEDDCSAANVTVELDADYLVSAGFQRTRFVTDNEISDNADGSFRVSLAGIPVGEHALRVRAGDGCGNFDVEIIEFCVTADKAPTPICIQTLTVTLMPDGDGGGMADIWAADFIASDVEDCFGNVIDRFAIYTEGEIENGISPTFPRQGVTLTCENLGDADVRVYAFDDRDNNDYCSVVVEVQDNNDICDVMGRGTLAGTIATQDDILVEDVQVNLTGANDMVATVTTDVDGRYSFTNLELGTDYTIEPDYVRPVDLREVKTSDIVAVTRHILGTSLLPTAYDYVAGDVNEDEEIDIFDIIGIRRVILGLDAAFANPDGDSWVFVAADYNFGDLESEYLNAFPEVYNANDLQASILNADFVAVELGNVRRQGQGRSSLDLKVENARLRAGETHTIQLDGREVTGFQGTLDLGAGLELLSVDFNSDHGGMNLDHTADGLVGMSFGEPTVVSVIVRATVAGQLNELICLNDDLVYREGISGSVEEGTLDSRSIALEFLGDANDVLEVAGYRLLQNVPNPVRRLTTIGFELPEAHAEVTITVTNAAGRTVREYTQEGVVGYNSLTVSRRQLGGTSGVYSYTVRAGEWIATKRMVIVE